MFPQTENLKVRREPKHNDRQEAEKETVKDSSGAGNGAAEADGCDGARVFGAKKETTATTAESPFCSVR